MVSTMFQNRTGAFTSTAASLPEGKGSSKFLDSHDVFLSTRSFVEGRSRTAVDPAAAELYTTETRESVVPVAASAGHTVAGFFGDWAGFGKIFAERGMPFAPGVSGGNTADGDASIKAVMDAATTHPAQALPDGSGTATALAGEQITLSLAEAVFEVAEDTADGQVVIQFLLSEPAVTDVVINYNLLSNTALAGQDFIGSSGQVSISAGEQFATLAVPIVDDALSEGDELFSVAIQSVSGESVVLGVPRTASIRIADDESPTVPPPDEELESYGFTSTLDPYLSGLERPVGITWLPGQNPIALVAQGSGEILFFLDDETEGNVLLDISGQVNFVGDRGIMDLEVDPNFAESPYIYIAYVYDPPETENFPDGSLAGPDGEGNRPARISRFTVEFESDGTPTVDPASEVILVGAAGTFDNISGPDVNSTDDFTQPPSGIDPTTGENLQDYIAVDSLSHAPGDIEFGPDGYLYVTIGDGTSYNARDLRALRVQDIDNLSGKVLRIDPETGDGIADNPFWDGDASSNRSKVYMLGLRNGFRMEIDQSTGGIWIGEVGWNLWEQIEFGGAGANFGWPYFEGAQGVNAEQPLYATLSEAVEFYSLVDSGEAVVNTPYLSFSHGNAEPGPTFSAVILGEIYDGTAYPEELQNDLFFADFLRGVIYTVDVDDPTRTIRPLANVLTPTEMTVGPDGLVYVVSNFGGTIDRLEVLDQPPPPVQQLPAVTLSQASNPDFSQDRSDSFSLTSPDRGQFRQIEDAELDISGVEPGSAVQFQMTTDDLLLATSVGGADRVKNLLVVDPDELNLFASNFVDVEVDTEGASVIIVDGAERGRFSLSNESDTLVLSASDGAAAPVGASNTFDVELRGGDDAFSFTDSTGVSTLVVDAGGGDDVVVMSEFGDSRIIGGEGDDVLLCGGGDDTIVVSLASGQDIVGSFRSAGEDVIEFVGVAAEDITITEAETSTLITWNEGASSVFLVDVPVAMIEPEFFEFL